MNYNEYQVAAMRTCNIPADRNQDRLIHGITGLVSELAEYTEATIMRNREHRIKELGDCCWMIAEIFTAMNWKMEQLTSIGMDRHSPVVMFINSGVLSGMIQKTYQGKQVDRKKLYLTVLEIYSGLLCCAKDEGVTMTEIMETNIEKLKKRFPDGFGVERDQNRAKGDI